MLRSGAHVTKTSPLFSSFATAARLSFEEVTTIAEKFTRLNPYKPHIVKTILKIGDVNYDSEGKPRQIFCYSISSKRYALFIKTAEGIQIVKASGHGLGYLYAPKRGMDEAKEAPVWIVEAWDWIIRKALNLPCVEPEWFKLPAIMRIVIRTPEVLKVLQKRQKRWPYRERTKSFNFISSPLIMPLIGYPDRCDPDKFFLVAPFSPNSTDWYGIEWVNVYDGKSHRLTRPGNETLPTEATAQTYRNVLLNYSKHAEAKSVAPDGKPCNSRTAGLLRRMPIIAADEFRIIGKETDRKWEEEEDISLVDFKVREYRPEETKRMVSDPTLQNEIKALPFSEREFSRLRGFSRNTIQAARKGKPMRKATVSKILSARCVRRSLCSIRDASVAATSEERLHESSTCHGSG